MEPHRPGVREKRTYGVEEVAGDEDEGEEFVELGAVAESRRSPHRRLQRRPTPLHRRAQLRPQQQRLCSQGVAGKKSVSYNKL